MKTTSSSTSVSLFLAAVYGGFSAFALEAQIVINEFAYDDAGADDYEFVELFNRGPAPVDISGWILSGFDQTGANAAIAIPAGTTLAPGGFYVIGHSAVANRHQTAASGLLENDQEAITLRDAGGLLQDEVAYEMNKGLTGITEGGLWGNFQSGQLPSGQVRMSNARFVDGRDTGVNGRDFGFRRATPGGPNSGESLAVYTGPDIDSLAEGEEAPDLVGAFVSPRAVAPGNTNLIVGATRYNPNAIPPSPQGGQVVVAWDNAGGGSGGASDSLLSSNAAWRLHVYVDPRRTTGADHEEWTLGIGGADPQHNFSTGDANGTSGIAWLFRRDAGGAALSLIDFGAGGPTNSWITLGSVDLGDSQPGWHELSLTLSGPEVAGTFDSTVISGTTEANIIGSFLFSYREGFANNDLARPLTFDMIPEPSSYWLALIGAGLLWGIRQSSGQSSRRSLYGRAGRHVHRKP